MPFTVILGGGGVRGFAHIGILKGLETMGFRPSAVVGVSMGAIVGAVYAIREDWYDVLRDMSLDGLPNRHGVGKQRAGRLRTALQAARILQDLWLHWGVAESAATASRMLLRQLTLKRNLEDGRLDIAICATDLRSGTRTVLRSGNAGDIAYASSALAGVVPPWEQGDRLLADGAYSDIAPIDVARSFGHPVVIAVDPGQQSGPTRPRNGVEVLIRAMEICHSQHAHLRFEAADLVLRPRFRRTIDALDFGARRECIAAGLRLVRSMRPVLEQVLLAAP